MNSLSINFISLFPYAIDAYTLVYGEEYRSMISEKINHTIVASYRDLRGLEDYISYLKECKIRELSIRFLNEIGIDVLNKDNYSVELDKKTKGILDCFIYSDFAFDENEKDWSYLFAFDINNKLSSDILLNHKLKIINYLLGNNENLINEDNFESFTKTDKYLELLNIIDKYIIIYKRLMSEYREWSKQFEHYKKYIKEEKERKKEYLQQSKENLICDIFNQLPLAVRNFISDKDVEEQASIVLGPNDILFETSIEFFSSDIIERLKSTSTNLFAKWVIMNIHLLYLSNLGVVIPNEEMFNCKSEKDVSDYLSFLNQDDVKKYIPTDELINFISSTRKKRYEEALKAYTISRNDFLNIIMVLGNTQENIDIVYKIIKEKRVCVTASSYYNYKNEFLALMFFTIREYEGGALFHTFMHECGHVIDKSEKRMGFECFDGIIEKNPYDINFRKYEKFNETLNDIFTIEAVNKLNEQGYYLIEPKEILSLNTINMNTSLITKELLYPLIQKFRSQVIKAKVNSNPQELTRYIGDENYEELVDAVNKVDYLSRNGVESLIKKKPEDDMVIQYYDEVERVKQIYINIDNYYATNFLNLSKKRM